MITFTKKDLGIFIIGLVLAFFLFFYQSASFESHFKHILDNEYQQLSLNIFKPQTRFSAESILVPLLGKIFGASKSAYSYQMFIALFQFAILPLVALILSRYITNTFAAYFALIIFAFSFTHLRNYYLGFPDAVTMLCLIVFAVSTNNKSIFISALLAFLSHFTLTIFGGIAIFSILFFLKKENYLRIKFWNKLSLFITAMIIGKLALLMWYRLFQYNFSNRFNYIFEHRSVGWFIEQYKSHINEFWTTPGLLFLFCNLVICTYLLMKERRLFIGWLCAFSTAYLCLFMSEDGLRIFSVVIVGSYVLLLIKVVPELSLDLIKLSMSKVIKKQ